MENTILVTGGAGFIGSNFILQRMERDSASIVNLDKLTYAGNLHNLEADCKRPAVRVCAWRYCGPRAWCAGCWNGASHGPLCILRPRAMWIARSAGRKILSARMWTGLSRCWRKCGRIGASLGGAEKVDFRFLHVSTDEVYGSLGPDDPAFSETTAYAPNSPYAASKAASDHFVRAYHHTYGLPALTTNCSNNYGRFQFPEKLIPLVILNARDGKPLPVYGDGQNVRDWLYVEDHCEAIATVLAARTSRDRLITSAAGTRSGTSTSWRRSATLWMRWRAAARLRAASLITFVKDRPGHDRRYAMDATKIERELGWRPLETFESGIRKTVRWYLENEEWVRDVTSGSYRQWIETHYSS